MVCSPIKRVAFACALLTLRVVGLSFGFYVLPNHRMDMEMDEWASIRLVDGM